MRIDCPFCGLRDVHEFTVQGDGMRTRPAADAGEVAHADYVYLRDNPAGVLREYWYHGAGCRRWLAVTRDTCTHEVLAAAIVKEAAR